MNRHLFSAAALRVGSFQSLGRWVSSRVVWYMSCAISGKHGTVAFSWREHGQNYRHTVRHVGEREQWHHVWHWQHVVDMRASHLLMKVWTWQTLLVRWEEKTEDVVQPRLREIDRFFCISLAQVGLFLGDKNAPDEFGAVFQGSIDM